MMGVFDRGKVAPGARRWATACRSGPAAQSRVLEARRRQRWLREIRAPPRAERMEAFAALG
eukprot:11225693-Lingulodinium_polyedra.AAC.1